MQSTTMTVLAFKFSSSTRCVFALTSTAAALFTTPHPEWNLKIRALKLVLCEIPGLTVHWRGPVVCIVNKDGLMVVADDR